MDDLFNNDQLKAQPLEAPLPETAPVLPAVNAAAHPLFEAQAPPSTFVPNEVPPTAAPAAPQHQPLMPAPPAPQASPLAEQPVPVAHGAPQFNPSNEELDAPTDSDTEAPKPASVSAPRPAPSATASMDASEGGSAAAGAGAPKSRKGPHRGGRGGVITLKLLIDEGVLQPGEDVLSVEYKGLSHTASLTPAGKIILVMNGKEMMFESPSAFSIYLKRLVNPTRKADDGWKTVKYKGRLLEQFKGELLKKKMGEDGIEFDLPTSKRTRFGGMDTGSVASLNALRASAAVTAAVQQQEEEERMERPRRVRKAPPRFAALGVDDEHALQPLEAYGPGGQPFAVRVSPAVEAVMDFHAHLCMNEVIGILAGTWDAATKTITILRAFPVKELATEDDSINVEMDPESEVAAREEITTKLNMRVVGWYHSHPTFPTQPSRIDIYNQVIQQHHNREEATGAEPYVAAIVGPYDRRQATLQASITWFYVDHTPGKIPAEGQRPEDIGCIAKSLQVESLPEDKGLENLTPLQRELEHLAKRYAPLPDRAHLEGTWKDGHARIEKLVASVQSRLPASLGDAKLKNFGNKVYVSTRAVWNVYGVKAEAPAAAGMVASGSAVALAGEVGGAAGAPAADPQDAEDEPISDDDE